MMSCDYIHTHREEVDRMVKELKLKLFRTSVKENFNVEQGIAQSEYGGLCKVLMLLCCSV